jgi:hypothetical protein
MTPKNSLLPILQGIFAVLLMLLLLSAFVSAIPVLRERASKIEGKITHASALVGDITGPAGWPDGFVDMRDIGLVARHFSESVPPAPANCDLTGPTAGVPDGKIDMRDIGLVARHFGDHYP